MTDSCVCLKMLTQRISLRLWKKRDGNDPIRSDAMLSSRDSFSHLETHFVSIKAIQATQSLCLSRTLCISEWSKKENGIISISAHVRHHWSFMLHRTSRIDFTYFMLCSLLWRNPEGKVFWRKQREIVTFCLLSNPYPLLCRYQCKKKGTSQALFEKKHRHFLATKCSFQNTL